MERKKKKEYESHLFYSCWVKEYIKGLKKGTLKLIKIKKIIQKKQSRKYERSRNSGFSRMLKTKHNCVKK